MLRPVDGLEVRTLLPTDYRPPLTWTPKQARSSNQMPKSNSGASGAAIRSSRAWAGVAAPGRLVVGLGLAIALGVLAPVWGKLRLYVHLMMSLFEIFDDWPVRVEREDRGGGGFAMTAAPDHGNFLQ